MLDEGTSKEPKAATADSALLIIDMITDFEFEDGKKLFPHAKSAAENIAALKSRAKAHGIPAIYVNDNYGKWNEDFKTYLANVKKRSEMGREVAGLIEPQPDDYFILKPQRSGFYATPLAVLLLAMNVSRLIVTGVSTDMCILFTVHDAYMRGYRLAVPSDCSAAVEPTDHTNTLRLMERIAYVDTTASSDLDLTSTEHDAEDRRYEMPQISSKARRTSADK